MLILAVSYSQCSYVLPSRVQPELVRKQYFYILNAMHRSILDEQLDFVCTRYTLQVFTYAPTYRFCGHCPNASTNIGPEWNKQ